MQLPWIQKLWKDANKLKKLTLVPLMVGDLPEEKYQYYAQALLPLFMEERTVFIVSSDFCHWGKIHKFTKTYEDEPMIHNSIERLDRQGLDLIEKHRFNDFT